MPPLAAFTAGCTGLTCSFDSAGSSDSDGALAGYAWDFGDGTSGSGGGPSHTYASAGSYTVQLTVTDDDGATGSASRNVVSGVVSLGLSTTVFPAAIAGAIFQIAMFSG